MKSQINGLNQAIRNSQDGISLIQTAEGAMIEIHDMMQRMRTLATQARNGTYELKDQTKLQAEMNELIDEIDGIVKRSQFNGMQLLDGTYASKNLQIGANTSDTMTVTIATMTTSALGSTAKVSSLKATGALTSTTGINTAEVITILDEAIEQVSAERSKLGAMQNRLDHTINNLGVAAENLSAANSRIRDVDMAAEMMNFTRNQILIQAGTAMLAQANARPQSVLQLLG
jgi:flagellin